MSGVINPPDWSRIRNFVVVAFGDKVSKGSCELSHCPMRAHGPYTRTEAQIFSEELPDWMKPHILELIGTPLTMEEQP